MVSEDIIRRRLSKLEESLRRLESKKKVARKEFLNNWKFKILF